MRSEAFSIVTGTKHGRCDASGRHVIPCSDVLPPIASLRVGAAWGLPFLLEESGVAAADVLAEAGLPANLFEDRNNRVTYPQLARVFAVCERRLQCDHVGLLVGQRARLADMGLAGEAALCEPTAGAALRAFQDHCNLHDTAAMCTLVESGAQARLVYTVLEYGMEDTRHFQLASTAIGVNILQDLCGDDFEPLDVRFATRAPTNPRVCKAHFRIAPLFDCDESSITFARRWLEHPLPPVSEARRADVALRAAAQHQAMLADFPAIVRRVVRKHLLFGDFSMDDVAAVLSMHRRTLDRHLQAHGVQYGDLVEQVKENVARQLLRDTMMPIQRIAATVRFSSAANFATAFRRRVGMTPSAYRHG